LRLPRDSPIRTEMELEQTHKTFLIERTQQELHHKRFLITLDLMAAFL